jgi:DnaJ-class molecular chaperone
MIISRAKAEEAAGILHVMLDGLTPELLKGAYRDEAKETHPDAGGSAEAFARVDWAKCALEAWLEKAEQTAPVHKQENCTLCDGKGYVIQRKGLSGGLRRQCGRCRGTGDANLDIDTANEG